MKKYNVAILGATGAVGTEFLKLIEERNFPFAELRLLASKRSEASRLNLWAKHILCRRLPRTPSRALILLCSQAAAFPRSLLPTL